MEKIIVTSLIHAGLANGTLRIKQSGPENFKLQAKMTLNTWVTISRINVPEIMKQYALPQDVDTTSDGTNVIEFNPRDL